MTVGNHGEEETVVDTVSNALYYAFTVYRIEATEVGATSTRGGAVGMRESITECLILFVGCWSLDTDKGG